MKNKVKTLFFVKTLQNLNIFEFFDVKKYKNLDVYEFYPLNLY